MALPSITIVGNLTADPELKFLSSGQALVTFRIAASDRRKNAQTGEWEDGDTTFLRVTAWRQTAENAAESLTKGDRVVVTGRLKSRDYEDKDGSRKTSYEIDADEVGVALSRASARVNRSTRTTGTQTPANDGWDTPAGTNEVPF
jgi:single-strand DNA-binding protein